MACLLALSLAGCYEYRGPYTRADIEEYLAGRYPDETIHVRKKGLQTWECWFDELPDAVFQVWVGQGGGDPVPMLYSRLVSDEAEVLPEYYLEQYQEEGGSLDAWELRDSIFYTQYSSMGDAGSALEQLSDFSPGQRAGLWPSWCQRDSITSSRNCLGGPGLHSSTTFKSRLFMDHRTKRKKCGKNWRIP